MRTLKELAEKEGRVWLFCRDQHTGMAFFRQAKEEGFRWGRRISSHFSDLALCGRRPQRSHRVAGLPVQLDTLLSCVCQRDAASGGLCQISCR